MLLWSFVLFLKYSLWSIDLSHSIKYQSRTKCGTSLTSFMSQTSFQPWFLWRKLSCSHDLTAVYTYRLSYAHLLGTITNASHRWLQLQFQCHQHLVIDDKNFPLLFRLRVPGISTKCYLRITGLHFLLCLEGDWETRNCSWAQGLKLICLLMAVEKDSEGLESPRQCPWKQPADKIAAQAANPAPKYPVLYCLSAFSWGCRRGYCLQKGVIRRGCFSVWICAFWEI